VPSCAFYPLLVLHPHLFRSFSSRICGWQSLP
jgi:hypothetical protein